MRHFLFIAIVAIACAGATVEAAEDVLLERARRQALAADSAWLRLGHWQATRDGGYLSQVDDPAFFLAKSGKRNPSVELTATLQALLESPLPGQEHLHPLCRFPARSFWLRKTLDIDLSTLPEVSCQALTTFLERSNPESASVIFSSYYIQDPASSFGHTFVRLNRIKDSELARQELLDIGVDYAAQADDANPLIYGIKGLSGLYRGRFSFMPYYFKVREYADFESRDLWEYELNLDDDQLAMFVFHLWELGHVYFDYYFLNENCSYHILSAIETARPDVDLKRHIRRLVIPGDTVKALFENEGLVRSVRFRPSLARHFLVRLNEVPASERRLVTELLNTDDATALLAELDIEARARVLDAAADLVDLRFADDLLYYDAESKGAELKHSLLAARARLGYASPPVTVPVPWAEQPTLTHGSSRAGILGGYRRGDGAFLSLEFRYAFHDLADRPQGYPEYGLVQFLEGRLDIPLEGNTPRPQRFSFLDVAAINPWTRHHKTISWQAGLGAERTNDVRCRSCFAGKAYMHTGAAVATPNDRMMLAVLTGGNVRGHEDMQGIAGGPIRIAAQAYGLARLKLTDDMLLLATPGIEWAPWQGAELSLLATATWRWLPRERVAINIDAETFRRRYEVRGGLYYYF